MRRLLIAWLLIVGSVTSTGVAQTQTTLRLGHFMNVENWDPIAQTQPENLVYFDVVYDTLVTMDFAGRLLPRLATAWEYTDPLTLVFTLREDVIFNDGTPFDAHVARENIERAKAEGAFLVRDELATVAEASALDDYTLQLTLLRNDDFLLTHLTAFSGMMVSPQAFATTAEVPVGSGPYQLDVAASSEKLRVFQRFEGHWRDEPSVMERIEMLLEPPDILVTNLYGADLDIAIVPPAFAKSFAEDPQFNTITVDSNLYLLAFLDRAGELVPELQNRDVRCAISHAIDRELYTQQFGGTVLAPMDTIPPPSWYGFAPDAINYPFDIDTARALLLQSGIESKPVLSLPVSPDLQPNVEFITSNLSELGIALDPVAITEGDFLTTAFTGEFPLALVTVEPSHFVLFVQQYVLSSGRFNPLNALDDEIEALVQSIRNLPLAEAEAEWQAVSRLINEQCYFVPLSFGSLGVIAEVSVQGIRQRFRTDGFIDLRQVYFGDPAEVDDAQSSTEEAASN